MSKERSDPRHQAALQHWTNIIAAYNKECAQSPITIKAWCLRNGISVDTFYHWKSALMKEEQATSARSPVPAAMVDITPFLVPASDNDTGSAMQHLKESKAPLCQAPDSFGHTDVPSIMIRLGDAQIFVGNNAKESTLLTVLEAVRHA